MSTGGRTGKRSSGRVPRSISFQPDDMDLANSLTQRLGMTRSDVVAMALRTLVQVLDAGITAVAPKMHKMAHTGDTSPATSAGSEELAS